MRLQNYALVIAAPVNLHVWDCDNWNLVATVNQPITPVTCTCTTYRTPRFNPQLPVGLSYEYTANGSFKTVRIVGTPSVPQHTLWVSRSTSVSCVLVSLELPRI